MNLNKPLSISDKLASFDDSFWNDHIPAFDINKNELTAVHPQSTHFYITDLTQIAQQVNTLSKPIYQEIDKFYSLFRNIEKINKFIQQQQKFPLIDTNSFCRALRPSSQELKSRLWAVHVSDYLWPDAVMTPFIKKLGTQVKEQGHSITVHFSLGEMVRPHSNYLNWKYRDVAVITPLSELTGKLAGIYPYDSFIHGEWKISPKAILIVSKGIKVPDNYSQNGIKVVTFDPETSTLRKTIKKQIQENRGIHLKMVRNLLHPGSPAYLYGNKKLNVNNLEFFESLFQEYKDLSFGLDTMSLNNRNGYCYGMLRQFSGLLVNRFEKNPLDGSLIEFYHYIEFLYDKLQHQLSDQERVELASFLKEYKPCANIVTTRVTYAATDIICNLTSTELVEFKARFPFMFPSETDYVIDASWAVKRWLMLGSERGKEEDLEGIYRNNLRAFFCRGNLSLLNSDVIDTIANYMEGESERAELVLYILNLPETKEYNRRVAVQYTLEIANNISLLSKNCRFFSTDYSADSLELALRAFETKSFFEISYMGEMNKYIKIYKDDPDGNFFTEASKEKLHIFTNLLPINLETDLNTLKNSRANLLHAITHTPNNDAEDGVYNKSVADFQYEQSVLHIWKRTHGAYQLWRKFHLEKEYSSSYVNEQEFWNSNESFIEIYRRLKVLKSTSQTNLNL